MLAIFQHQAAFVASLIAQRFKVQGKNGPAFACCATRVDVNHVHVAVINFSLVISANGQYIQGITNNDRVPSLT